MKTSKQSHTSPAHIPSGIRLSRFFFFSLCSDIRKQPFLYSSTIFLTTMLFAAFKKRDLTTVELSNRLRKRLLD
jgi:hypothetical protein